jgi:hypothetical protein
MFGLALALCAVVALGSCGKKAQPEQNSSPVAAKGSAGSDAASLEPKPFDDGAAYSADSPEKIVCDFMAAWRDADFLRMAKYTLASWAANDGSPVDTLRDYLSGQKLTGFKVLSVQAMGESEMAIQCELWATPEGAKTPGKATVSVTVTRESKWGVNPVALSTVKFK